MDKKKPFYKRWIFWKWFGIVYIALILFGFILDLTGYSDKLAEDQAVAEAEQAEKEAADKMQRDTERYEAQAKKDAEKRAKVKAEQVKAEQARPKSLVDAARKVFSEHYISMENIGGTEEITVNLAQNLTQNLMLKGTYMDAIELGEVVVSNGLLADADAFLLVFTTELTDKYGNTSVSPVVKIKFGQATLDKINFANVSYNNVPSIADSYWHHPLFNNK